MTASPESWRELVRFDDPHIARTVAVSIAAMEFPVRSVAARSDAVIDWSAVEDSDDGESAETSAASLDDMAAAGPIAVQVREGDWADLNDILPELIDEQVDFDAYCRRRDRSVGRAQRAFLFVLIAIVAVLATIGAIRL